MTNIRTTYLTALIIMILKLCNSSYLSKFVSNISQITAVPVQRKYKPAPCVNSQDTTNEHVQMPQLDHRHPRLHRFYTTKATDFSNNFLVSGDDTEIYRECTVIMIYINCCMYVLYNPQAHAIIHIMTIIVL